MVRRLTVVAIATTALFAAAIASAETTQSGTLRVTFDGKITPRVLPRAGSAPVTVALSGRVDTSNHSAPPQLRRISMAINRHGSLDYTGLPLCHYHQIQPASSRDALASCRASLVGTGTFAANVALPEQSPFPNDGKLLAFNGILHHHHVLFAHIFGKTPIPQSSVLVFAITRTPGTYRVTLSADLPRVAADWGYVSGISLNLSRRYTYRHRPHSYLSAGCPLPDGVRAASYPFARATFAFAGARTLRSSLTRTCRAR